MPRWTREKEKGRKKKEKRKHFYIIYTDLSTFSTKDNLSVFWTVNLCQLQIRTGGYTMWLSELSLSANVQVLQGGERLQMHACYEGWWICAFNYLYMSSDVARSLQKWILTTERFQHVLKIPCVVCVVQFSDLASLMLMSMDSVSYIHCPSTVAAINTLALKRWLTFIQGFQIQQLLAEFMALLAGQH